MDGYDDAGSQRPATAVKVVAEGGNGIAADPGAMIGLNGTINGDRGDLKGAYTWWSPHAATNTNSGPSWTYFTCWWSVVRMATTRCVARGLTLIRWPAMASGAASVFVVFYVRASGCNVKCAPIIWEIPLNEGPERRKYTDFGAAVTLFRCNCYLDWWFRNRLCSTNVLRVYIPSFIPNVYVEVINREQDAPNPLKAGLLHLDVARCARYHLHGRLQKIFSLR